MLRMRISIRRMSLIVVGLAGTYDPSMAQSTERAEDVCRQVVSALAGNDQAALTKLSVDQPEFKKYVWPGVYPISNMSADKYYPTFQKASQVGITEVRHHSGREEVAGGQGRSPTCST